MVGSLLQPIPAYMLRTCVQSRETMDEFDRQDFMSPLQLCRVSMILTCLLASLYAQQLGVELTMSAADATSAEMRTSTRIEKCVKAEERNIWAY